jgi:NAD(P)-dependent dehydrogenase (short-subunit alcohol dehydrogenase family)
MAIPGINAYIAAKTALAGFTECLAVEVESFGIRACCVEPGDFRTKVFKVRYLLLLSATFAHIFKLAAGKQSTA